MAKVVRTATGYKRNDPAMEQAQQQVNIPPPLSAETLTTGMPSVNKLGAVVEELAKLHTRMQTVDARLSMLIERAFGQYPKGGQEPGPEAQPNGTIESIERFLAKLHDVCTSHEGHITTLDKLV